MTTSHACIISAAGEIRLEDFLPAGATEGGTQLADNDGTLLADNDGTILSDNP